jgi:nucleotide-binding universal stress UspA family protein
MLSIRRILFPTDFSPHADFAWPYALTFAHTFAAELHLLHVVTPPPRLTETYVVDFDPEKVVEAMSEEARRALEILRQAAAARGLQVRQSVRLGLDFQEIIEYARAEGVDLIVMATHGRTGLAHVLVGSVAERVVRKSPCPVLTVKPATMRLDAPTP